MEIRRASKLLITPVIAVPRRAARVAIAALHAIRAKTFDRRAHHLADNALRAMGDPPPE